MTRVVLSGTVLLSMAWLATALLRRSPADLRHRIWLTALAGMLLGFVPLPAPQAIDLGAFDVTSLTSSATPTSDLPIWTVLWLSGASVLLLRFGRQLWRLARITRSARNLGGNVLLSDAISSPCTWGVIRPVILLPAQRVSSLVLQHEQAHIERRDWLWQTFAQLMTAVFWFHPLVWFAAHHLRVEAETCADDHVLSSGASPAEYAQELLTVAQRIAQAPALAAVPMARGSQVSNRVTAILNPNHPLRPSTSTARASVIVTGLALVLTLAACTGSAVHNVREKGVTPPSVRSKVDPQYTEQARTDQIQGSVLLSIEVDPTGHARRIKIDRSLRPDLDQKAVEAVQQWQFTPGRKNGKPVAVAAKIEINFKLL